MQHFGSLKLSVALLGPSSPLLGPMLDDFGPISGIILGSILDLKRSLKAFQKCDHTILSPPKKHFSLSFLICIVVPRTLFVTGNSFDFKHRISAEGTPNGPRNKPQNCPNNHQKNVNTIITFLGPFWSKFRSQKDPQNAPKIGPKNDILGAHLWIPFFVEFWSSLGASSEPSWAT